jgi:hypothetical protein
VLEGASLHGTAVAETVTTHANPAARRGDILGRHEYEYCRVTSAFADDIDVAGDERQPAHKAAGTTSW